MKYSLKSSGILSMPKKNTLEAAEELMSGKLYVDLWFDERMDYSIDNLDWNVQYSKAPTTHQLYLQGLTPVAYLTGAYVIKGDAKYIELAIKIFYNWNVFSKSDESKKNEYIWDEHAVAIRAESLLYLATVAEENSIYINESLYNSICVHAKWLADDTNYLYGTNHGVYEDKALIYLGYAIGNQDYIDVAKARLINEMKEMFTEEAISTENSFNYHRVNKELFSEIGLVLSSNNDEYGKELMEMSKRAEDFMGYAIKPDGNCSTYGDTLLAEYKKYNYINKESVLAYVLNKEEKNHSIDKPDKIVSYPESGYFICREFWPDEANDKIKK